MANNDRIRDRSHYAADDNWDKYEDRYGRGPSYDAPYQQNSYGTGEDSEYGRYGTGADFNPGGFARVGNTGSFGLPGRGEDESDFDNNYSNYGNYNSAHTAYGRDSGFGSAPRREESGRYRGKGPKDYKRSDERLFEDVCERLSDDAFVDASDIEVRVEGSEVVLSGTVHSRQEKRRAEDLAESIRGVRNVLNDLRIA